MSGAISCSPESIYEVYLKRLRPSIRNSREFLCVTESTGIQRRFTFEFFKDIGMAAIMDLELKIERPLLKKF